MTGPDRQIGMDILAKIEDSPEAKAHEGRGPLDLRARTQNGCVVCGQENPYGLRIHFVRERDGAFTAEWRPTENWEGFEGIVHGGIMTIQSIVYPQHIGHLLGDVPTLFIIAIVLGVLTPWGEKAIKMQQQMTKG